MSANNLNSYPLKIVGFTCIVLLLLSTVLPSKFWHAFGFNEVNIIADLSKQEKHFTKKTKQGKPLKQLVQDNIPANKEVAKIIRNDVAIEYQDTLSDEGLTSFLNALHQLQQKKRKKVRIGYFGDSMIEGDLVTQTIRTVFQNKFGGDGVGFIPVTSIVSDYRQTVKTKASENWKDVHYNNNKEKLLIGFSGHSFFPIQDAKLTVKPGGGKHLTGLYQLSLWCGRAESELVFQYNNEWIKADAPGYFNKLKLSDKINKAEFVFQESNTPVFGLSSESEQGVILDNFSFRGTSGTELTRLNSKMLKQIDSLHHYDLIVLHYGPNLLWNDSIKEFSWYKKQMVKTLKHLKNAFPNTSFLIVSTADKAFKVNGTYQTADGVEPLLKVQQELAQQFNCAFYNLYEAMGGYNSMKTWAEKKPILAGNDYTHFNISGSAKIGRLISNAILNEYEKVFGAN